MLHSVNGLPEFSPVVYFKCYNIKLDTLMFYFHYLWLNEDSLPRSFLIVRFRYVYVRIPTILMFDILVAPSIVLCFEVPLFEIAF